LLDDILVVAHWRGTIVFWEEAREGAWNRGKDTRKFNTCNQQAILFYNQQRAGVEPSV